MYETISFEEFKRLMEKAIAIQGCPLLRIESITYPRGVPCTLQNLHSCCHEIAGYSLFRTIHDPKVGNIYQAIKQHTDKL